MPTAEFTAAVSNVPRQRVGRAQVANPFLLSNYSQLPSLIPSLNRFKAHDIRGQVPEELSGEIDCGIGRAMLAELRGSRTFVIGHDMRVESRMLANALIKGLTEAGADVIDIGLCDTGNLRDSNIEPLLRLNVETRGDQQGVSKLEQLILE
ncbi:hypothetical protein [Geopseudomonas aromaticivorans]|uniref:hypothetical protein n=1 Tax=Geopseudomonas aromaticivorans TaxID=2849492 RepID=UPI003F5D52C3